jgi:hypothetical protein
MMISVPPLGLVYQRSLLPRLASGVSSTKVLPPIGTPGVTVTVWPPDGIVAMPLMPANFTRPAVVSSA